jgi:hypothetical protein
MNSQKKSVEIFCLLILISVTYIAKAGKAVYVSSDFYNRYLKIYQIDGNSLTDKATKRIQDSYPTGLAIHESGYGRWLYYTREYNNNVGVVDTCKMVKFGETEVYDVDPNTYGNGMSGIVMDNINSKLYFMQRWTNRLWSYSWEPATQTLTPDTSNPIRLQGMEWGFAQKKGAFGIALDEENDLLYVADKTKTIEYYNTNDWSYVGELNIDCNAISIAIDADRQLLYFGSIGLGYGDGDPCLYQYNLVTDEINYAYIGNAVAGIAVDKQTGFVYVTTSSQGIVETRYKLMTFDPNLQLHGAPKDMDCPTGLVVGEEAYRVPAFDIVKDDNDAGEVEPLISQDLHQWAGIPYNWLYYNVNWDANGFNDSNVVVTDFLPIEVNEPNYISDNGVYDPNLHAVKWFLTNFDGNSTGSFKIQCGVNYRAKPGGVITNRAVIEGDRYTYWQSIDTNVAVYGGEIIYVDEKAQGYETGASWDNAYLTLRAGLAAAADCGAAITAIWVGSGTYEPVESTAITNYQNKTFTIPSNLALIGHFGGVGTYETSPDQRVLNDANNIAILEGRIGTTQSQAVFNIITASGISNALIDGFTIRNSYSGSYPGAVYLNDSDVSLLNCRFENNNQYGIYAKTYSFPNIHNCTFFNNAATGAYNDNHCQPYATYSVFDGNNVNGTRGLQLSYLCSATVENCIFKNNKNHGIYGTGNGSLNVSGSQFTNNQYGLRVDDITTVITDCNITNSTQYNLYGNASNIEIENTSISNSTQYGVYLLSDSVFTAKNSIIKNNTYDGIYTNDSDFSITHSLISNNRQNGIYATGGCNSEINNSVIRRNGYNGLRLADCPTISVKNSWINKNGTTHSTGNGCSGIYFENTSQTPVLRNNTIYDNYTYGVQMNQYGPDPNVRNCIVYGNDVNDFYRPAGDPFDAVRYSCLQHSRTGAGNFVANPMFLNSTDPNNLHIDSDSPCVNAGDPCGVYANETDIDGETRNNGRVDCGADEDFWSYADYDLNGIVNGLDYRYLAQDWIASQSNYSLDDDNDVDMYDLSLFCENWLWQNQTNWLDTLEGRSLQSLETESLQMESLSLSRSLVSVESVSKMSVASETESVSSSGDSLMITDLSTSKALMPKKLAKKVNSFYAITPESVAKWKARTSNPQRSVVSRSAAIQSESLAEPVDVNSLLNWLDDAWTNDPNIRNSMTEAEYLEFRNSIENAE